LTLRLSLARYQRPLPRGTKSPRLKLEHRRGLILTLEDTTGVFGQGEAAPLPGYSNDSLSDAERVLTRLEPARLGQLLELVERADWGQELELGLEGAAPRKCASARFALETALFDLCARRQRKSLHALLREHSAWSNSELEPVDRAALVALGPDSNEAQAALAAGFRSLKCKLGPPARFEQDYALLAQLRRDAGSEFRLRLDANQSLAPELAAESLRQLRGLELEFVEEPTLPGAPWTESPAVGVALDESLRSEPSLSAEVCRRHGLVALILKPSMLGLLHCLSLARNARELGLAAIVSHSFEGPVGFSTLLEFALALGPERFAHGVGPHGALEAWSEVEQLGQELPRWTPHARLGNGLERVELHSEEWPAGSAS
jgi:o-succinylbenzoate synthase